MNIKTLVTKVIYKYKNKELKYAIIKRIKKLFNRYLIQKKSNAVHKHYKLVIKQLKKKVAEGDKIHVGFYILYDSMFSAEPLFKIMLSDNLFNPFIVITPDTSRGNENMNYILNKSYNTFIKSYGKEKVLLGYNKNEFIDYSDNFDIIYLASPYDQTHKYFQIDYLKDKKLLTIHTSYGYTISNDYFRERLIKLPFMSLVWKIFLETEYTLINFKKYGYIKGKNLILSGYCKLDEFEEQNKIYRDRKRIIIAPHHSIPGCGNPKLALSNFLDYYELFLELPVMYPETDFIFRPHPLLFVNLARDEIWGKEKTNLYLKKLLENKNVTYSEGGDYYNIFKNSDALIHDCGSFMVEYLITENPCCYMFKENMRINDVINKFAQECLNLHYKAFEKKDIIDFIENVIINGNDINKKKRINFVNETIKINYPNVSEKILRYIKNQLQ